MLANTVLLICREAALAEEIGDALASSSGVQLEVFTDFEEACDEVREGDPGLVAVHLGDGIGVRQVAHLLWLSSMRPRPVPVLAIGDTYQRREATDLLRMGVADYMSRADHSESLGPVIVSSIRAARGPFAPSEMAISRPGPRHRVRPSSVS